MDKYKCPKCGKVVLECDLVWTKCSENQVGIVRPFAKFYCPSCKRKKKPEYHELVRMEV